MRHIITLFFISAALSMGACSNDLANKKSFPGQETSGENAASSQEGLDQNPNGKDQTPDENSPGASDSNATPPAQVATETPPVDEEVMPPSQMTGSYLTAELLVEQSTNKKIVVGLRGFKNKERADSDEMIWNLSVSQKIGGDAVLQKTRSLDYDQLLEFDGSFEEFKAAAPYLKVLLVFNEVETGLSEILSDTMLGLLDTRLDEAPVLAEPVETPGSGQTGLEDVPPAKEPSPALENEGPKPSLEPESAE